MTEIGLYFSSATGNCANIANRIAEAFAPVKVRLHDVLKDRDTDPGLYEYLIFGIPTWDQDELHIDWEEFLPKLERVKLRRKRVAIFGLGDQHTYTDSFANSMGLLYQWLRQRKARILGAWPSHTYSFNSSSAIKESGKFVGLVLDEDNQSELSEDRINQWVSQLKKEFELEETHGNN